MCIHGGWIKTPQDDHTFICIVINNKKKKITVISSNADDFLKHMLIKRSQTRFRTGKTSSSEKKINGWYQEKGRVTDCIGTQGDSLEQ